MASILGGRSRPLDGDFDLDAALEARKRRRLSTRVPLPTPSASAPSNSTTTPRASPAAMTTALPDVLPSPPSTSAPIPPSQPPQPAHQPTHRPPSPIPHAVLAAAQIRLLSPNDLATDALGAYAPVRAAIAAANPQPGGLQALQTVLAQGPIAGERNFTVTADALAALNLPLAPARVTVALGLPRPDAAGTGSRMALPFFFASDAGLAGLFTAMRAGLGALGGLVDAAQLARTRAWLRGRSVPAPPNSPGGMCAYGLVLAEQAELWVMTRGPYFVARAWSGKLGTPEFAGVLASILCARGRAALVAQCLQTIKEGRAALASADEATGAAFDTWWRTNGGDTPARTFERGLAGVGNADGAARVTAWVRAQDVRAYIAPDAAE